MSSGALFAIVTNSTGSSTTATTNGSFPRRSVRVNANNEILPNVLILGGTNKGTSHRFSVRRLRSRLLEPLGNLLLKSVKPVEVIVEYVIDCGMIHITISVGKDMAKSNRFLQVRLRLI